MITIFIPKWWAIAIIVWVILHTISDFCYVIDKVLGWIYNRQVRKLKEARGDKPEARAEGKEGQRSGEGWNER